MTALQDAVTLAKCDAELRTAITVTETELKHVEALLALRSTPERVWDHLQVLARLADLKVQMIGETR